MKLLSVVIAGFLLIASCKTGQEKQVNNVSSNGATVKEAINSGGYTYLRVEQNGEEKWLAVNQMDAKVGETYYFEGGMTMTDFKSETLDRTFEAILFLDKISKEPLTGNTQTEQTEMSESDVMAQHHSGNVPSAKKMIEVDKAEGGITIAELYKNKKDYKGKKVKIRGEVTKFNEAILNTNWVHLQDGTNSEGKFDVTFKSDETFKVGDVVTLEGKVTLDVDLGHGYEYEVLVEDAVSE